ncbi:MAG TPA: deoxynucleoside kinase [Solirubrobacterales bacterium]|nr:deoxynucleoside kinase [Solirubrobacterales bacterium]
MIHHVGIEVAPADVERTAELFELLGFERVVPPPALAEGFTWLEREGTQIHLMHDEQPVVPARAHVAVLAPDFDATLGRLRSAGFEPEPRRPHWGAPRALVTGPGGHRVELMEAAPKSRPFIAIAGNIGTGKSGLTMALAAELGAQPLPEDLAANPFFDRFYADPSGWAFSSQAAFACDALRRHVVALDGRASVQDRTAFESYEVFARVLHEQGHLSDDQLRVLGGLRDCAAALPRQPDLLIYLEASTPSLASRIAQRDRIPERHVSLEYLELLQAAYEEFVSRWALSPVHSVDTDRRDLRDADQLRLLAREVGWP